ncbi:MAG TPA: iron-containing redox enzyme family protein [Chloroflexota bacterium]|nr:iron-containing redox enzyme family protein [Chloroflexota bacterium]
MTAIAEKASPAAMQFAEEIMEMQKANGWWLADGRFATAVRTGTATREELGRWATQFFIGLERALKRAHSRGRLGTFGIEDPEIKKFFWENRVEEEFGAISGTHGHIDLLMQFGEAVGVSRLDMVTASASSRVDRLGETATVAEDPERRTREPSQEAFLTGQIVTGLLEAMNPEVSTVIAEALRTHYGLKEDEIRFFTVHIVADAQHGDVALRLLDLIPQDRWPAIKDKAAEASARFSDMYNSIAFAEA